MKINGFRNVLSKKTLSAVTALTISGLVPAGLALAGELEITSELVASTTNVNVLQGEVTTFDLLVKSEGNVTNADVTIPTKFTLSAGGVIISSNNITKNFNTKDQTEIVKAEINVDSSVEPGTYELKFDSSNVSYNNINTTKGKLENKYTDTITILVSKKETPAPQDVTAPTISLTSEISGIYNATTLPNTFAFNLDEDSEVFINNVSQGKLTADSHELALPTSTEGNNTVTITAKDAAGNVSLPISFSYFYDSINPLVKATADREPNENGWYNEDVTVSFNATDDAGSGVATTDEPTIVSTEGKEQLISGTATDNAGNKGTDSIKISIDKTAPVINGFENGAEFTLNQVVENWTASDALSGLSTESSGTVDTSQLGVYSVSVTDKAGNTAVKTYKVVYAFGGFLQPINKDGSSVFKAGSTVPVKFQLTDALGAYISTANATISYAKFSNQVLGDEVEAISTSSATSGNLFRYDPISNQYIFNLSTKGLTAGSYMIIIKLGDGTTQTVKIGLK